MASHHKRASGYRGVTGRYYTKKLLVRHLLGTGGGGNPYTVKLYARELLKQGKRIAVVDPLTLPDDALVVAVGGMGAPTVSIERIIRGDEFL